MYQVVYYQLKQTGSVQKWVSAGWSGTSDDSLHRIRKAFSVSAMKSIARQEGGQSRYYHSICLENSVFRQRFVNENSQCYPLDHGVQSNIFFAVNCKIHLLSTAHIPSKDSHGVSKRRSISQLTLSGNTLKY